MWDRLEGGPKGLRLIPGSWAGHPVPEALDGESGHRVPGCIAGSPGLEDLGVRKRMGALSILRAALALPGLRLFPCKMGVKK